MAVALKQIFYTNRQAFFSFIKLSDNSECGIDRYVLIYTGCPKQNTILVYKHLLDPGSIKTSLRDGFRAIGKETTTNYFGPL